MNETQHKQTGQGDSPARVAETMMQRSAIAMGMVTMAYALSVTMQLVDGPVVRYLDWIQMALGLGVLVVVLPTFIKYSRLKTRLKDTCREADSFMANAFNQAARKAFSLTFVFMVVLQMLTRRHFTDLPTDFFINVILTFSLGVFSLTFFFLVRDNHDENDDFEQVVGS